MGGRGGVSAKIPISLGVLSVIALLLAPTPIFGQDPVQDPEQNQIPAEGAPTSPRQLMVNPTVEPGRQGLLATFSIFEAYDDVVYPGIPGNRGDVLTRPDYQHSGLYQSGSAALTYFKPMERTSITAGARASTSYFRETGSFWTSYGAFGGISSSFGRRTTVGVTQNVSYAPYYSLGVFPALAAPYGASDQQLAVAPGLDLAGAPVRTINYSTSANAAYRLSERSTLSINYSQLSSDAQSEVRDFTTRSAGGRYTRAMSQNASIHLGYNFHDSDYGTTRFQAHNIDVGVDYHRALSLSRRTTFSFSTGSALLAGDTLGVPTTFGQYTIGRYSFSVLGSAELDHQIGRTWSARLSYRRDWQFVPYFSAPFFSDAATAGIGGSVNRRTTLGASASYLIGTLAYGSDSNRQHSYTGTGWLRVGINRWLFAFGQYFYARYDFSNASLLFPGLAQTSQRNGVRGGLSASIPLIR